MSPSVRSDEREPRIRATGLPRATDALQSHSETIAAAAYFLSHLLSMMRVSLVFLK